MYERYGICGTKYEKIKILVPIIKGKGQKKL